ncbi:MAG: hypothetical protein ABIJ96_18005 [Elusimicrobiota bacterium]
MAETIPQCPHCDKQLDKWASPDGVSWGEYQYVCFNDACPYFVGGWKWMWEKFRHKVSYRHRHDPETGEQGPLPVWSAAALKDGIVKQD